MGQKKNQKHNAINYEVPLNCCAKFAQIKEN